VIEENILAHHPITTNRSEETPMKARRPFAIAVTAAAVGLLTPLLGPAAAVANEGSVRSGALHVTKECSQYTGEPGSFCTVTSSNVRPIEAGMRIVYKDAIDPVTSAIDTDIVVSFRHGSAGYGHVTLDPGGNTGTVTLNGGTGDFRKFHAQANVTCSDAVNCAWDGTYSFRR